MNCIEVFTEKYCTEHRIEKLPGPRDWVQILQDQIKLARRRLKRGMIDAWHNLLERSELKVGVTFWFSIFSPDAAEVEEGLNGPSTSMNIIYITHLTSLFHLTFLSLLRVCIFFYWCFMNKMSKNIYMFRYKADLNTVRYSYHFIPSVALCLTSPSTPIPSLIHTFVIMLLTFGFFMRLPKMSANYIITLCTLTLSSTSVPVAFLCVVLLSLYFSSLGFRLQQTWSC